MSVPGIGVLSALAYVSTVEDPARFGRSRSVGAHLGLTPRQYQSGEVDRSGRISRCGDTLARTLLYEAAVVILSRVKRASRLKDRARAIAKRSGNGKAGWRSLESSPLSCIASGVRASRSAGRSTQEPTDFIVRKIHPSKIADGMVARRARVRGLREWALSGVIVCQLVVDIAAPVLRTRCCGGLFRPRREP